MKISGIGGMNFIDGIGTLTLTKREYGIEFYGKPRDMAITRLNVLFVPGYRLRTTLAAIKFIWS